MKQEQPYLNNNNRAREIGGLRDERDEREEPRTGDVHSYLSPEGTEIACLTRRLCRQRLTPTDNQNLQNNVVRIGLGLEVRR